MEMKQSLGPKQDRVLIRDPGILRGDTHKKMWPTEEQRATQLSLSLVKAKKREKNSPECP